MRAISEQYAVGNGERRSYAPAILPAPSARKAAIGLGDIFLFVVPVLQFLQFKAVGTLFATDLLLLLACPVVIARGWRRLLQKQVAIVLFLGLLWLYSQVLTDVIRGSSPADYLRGWSKIFLTITHFATLWILMRDSIRRYALYGIGTCIGAVLSVVFFPTKYSIGAPWKFGFAMPVTFGLVIAAGWLSNARRKSLVLAVLLVMSGVNLYLNYRSLGLLCLMTAAYSYFLMQPPGKRKRLGKSQMVFALVAVCVSVWGFQALYIRAVQSGMLGRAAKDKYENQVGEGGMLLGGRSEILGSAAAIADSPLIGHGSWARDPKYAALMRQRRAELGYKTQAGIDSENPDLIPEHSHILGAWVEAGIVGALFWLWILKLIAGALVRATGAELLLPVLAFNALNLFWATLFSPYGAEERFLATYAIAGVLLFRRLTMSIKDARARGGYVC